MGYLCSFCKHHECTKEEEGRACNCSVTHQDVEHWFAACRPSFRDRRETLTWVRSERRRKIQAPINA